MHDTDLPGGREIPDTEITPEFDDSADAPTRSLSDDVSALIDDGKNYVEAEVAYQKTRLSFAANRSKSGVVYVLAAFAFLHLALIGLVIGGIVSLGVIIGPFYATLAVVGALLAGTVVFLLLAKGKFSSLARAFKDDGE